MKMQSIYALTINETNNRLIVGDSSGAVYIFDITRTGLTQLSQCSEMPLIRMFKAHAAVISDILIVDDYVVTCSADYSIRIFSQIGIYYGPFEKDAWNLDDLLPLDLRSDIASSF